MGQGSYINLDLTILYGIPFNPGVDPDLAFFTTFFNSFHVTSIKAPGGSTFTSFGLWPSCSSLSGSVNTPARDNLLSPTMKWTGLMVAYIISRWLPQKYVVVDGEKSNYINVESGVPQGSLLGPSLFLFYINDMPCGMNSTVRLFADDTIAYLAVTWKTDALNLQSDLNKLGKWAKMEFHPDKCNGLTISKKANPIKFDYKLHGHTL